MGRGKKLPEVRLVDVHVGQRMRARRKLLGLSQERLAGVLGVTFQQIQKYEKGVNRISAGTLYTLATALNVPVSFFFEEIQPGQATNPTEGAGELLSRREATLIRMWRALPSSVATDLMALVRTIVGEAVKEGTDPAQDAEAASAGAPSSGATLGSGGAATPPPLRRTAAKKAS